MLREEAAAGAPRFDAVDYLLYIRRRWKVIVVACVVAGALAGGVSLLTPKRYTSTASILIEPPAGTDPRSFTAISPVYLESLRTYERVAMSDSLFLRALERFRMFDPNGSQSVEGLKRRVLTVTKVRDTKVLEISATLQDPKEAQAMAQFLAEETVKLSSTATREAGQEIMEQTKHQLDEARNALEQARTGWAKHIADEPIEALSQEIASLVELEQRLRRNIAEAQAGAAEYEARARAAGEGTDAARDAAFLTRESASHKARALQFSSDLNELQRQIAEKDRLLASRTARRDGVEAHLKLAQTRFDSVSVRSESLVSSVGFGGERLRIIDPGIVPQQPSEPKTGLNLMIAFGLALLGSTVYLTLAYNLDR